MATTQSTNKFNNHAQMRKELRKAGVTIPTYCRYEADLVHLYDITFLVNFKLQNKL